jgi:uncharacterized membrane protein YqjE
MYSLIFLLTTLISLILIVLNQDNHSVLSILGLAILIISAIIVATLLDKADQKLNESRNQE